MDPAPQLPSTSRLPAVAEIDDLFLNGEALTNNTYQLSKIGRTEAAEPRVLPRNLAKPQKYIMKLSCFRDGNQPLPEKRKTKS